MAKGKKKKSKGAGTALAVIESDYAVIKAEQTIGALIQANLGGEKLTPFDLDRIKIPSGGGKFFEVPGLTGDTPEESIEGVVLFSKVCRAYWEKDNPDDSPPDCSSDDAINAVGSEAEACGGKCDDCPKSKFGSDTKAGRGQACKQMRQFFIVRKTDRLPMVITLPPTSLGPAKKYLLRLAQNGKRYYEVVTKFTLTPDKNADGQKYSKAEIVCVGELDEETAKRFEQASAELKPVFQAVRTTVES